MLYTMVDSLLEATDQSHQIADRSIPQEVHWNAGETPDIVINLPVQIAFCLPLKVHQ